MEQTLWTVDHVAQFLALKPNTIRQMARQRRIPCYQVGGKWRFDPRQVQQWLEAQAAPRPPTGAAGEQGDG